MENWRGFFLGSSLLLSEEKFGISFAHRFCPPERIARFRSSKRFGLFCFEGFFWGCVRPTLSGKYKQHLFLKQRRDGCKNRLQPFDPLSPHKECVVQSSFEIAFLLKHILPHYSLARLSQWRKDCLAHDQSQNFLGHQSLPLLCSPKVLYQMCCRRMWNAEEMWQNSWVWVTAGHQSAPVGLEWLPSCSTNILTRTDLGKMIIDPRPSFQTVWLNQKCWYPKNAQKDAECRRDVKGWLSG